MVYSKAELKSNFDKVSLLSYHCDEDKYQTDAYLYNIYHRFCLNIFYINYPN
jgi:hypothetical protein